VLTDFLSKESSKFRARIGTTASPHWPVGIVAESSSDMVEKVRNESGTLGYVESQYARRGGVSQASILNRAGKFVRASPESIAAASQAAGIQGWTSFSVSLINTNGADSFPITSFSWVYLRTKFVESARSAALADFLDWIYADGQQFASQEGYVSLPPPLLEALRKRVKAKAF
jgi:phosphate transport system substrate-binding protein